MNLKQLRDMTPTNTGPEDVLKELALGLAPMTQSEFQDVIQAKVTQAETWLARLKALPTSPLTHDGAKFSLGMTLHWATWNPDLQLLFEETHHNTHALRWMPLTGNWQVHKNAEVGSGKILNVAKCYSSVTTLEAALIVKLIHERNKLQSSIDKLMFIASLPDVE